MKTKFPSITLLIFAIILWSACFTDDTDTVPPKVRWELSLLSAKVLSTQAQTTKQVSIETNIDLDQLTISGGDTWVRCVLKKENKKLAVTIDANEGIKSRHTQFVVSGENLTDTLTVEQLGAEPAIIFVEKNMILDKYTAHPFTVELQSNMNDLIITPSADWITSVPTRSLERYTFSFQVLENDRGEERQATIKFEGQDGTIKDSITVTQVLNPTVQYLMAYNLNVVYFIPNDIDAPAEYERRISELMLWARDFYAENMAKNGFGNRGFGLRKISKDRINLITIHGKNGNSSYQYEGGSGAILNEINAYYEVNPEKKESDHTLVIVPSYTGDPFSPGGPPFYGTGRNCYALDYEYMDLKYLGEASQKGNLLTKWFGGLAHELGHGLNLPHNSQWVSQLNNPDFGTTLMGAGNYTLGLKPTFLSKGSCATLNNCQVFATENKAYYQSNGSVEIETFSIEHTATTIHVRGKYKNASKPINAINIYIDDYPYTGVNENYDAESWCITDLANNEFSIEIPLNEINKTDDRFRVRTWFLFDNGTYVEENHDFNRTDLNDYSFVTETDMPRKGWAVVASNQNSDGPARLMLDGKIDTYWHSQWQGGKPDHPHIITVDMKEFKTIRGLSFVQRQDLQGAINQFDLETSIDGIIWKNTGTHNLFYVARKQFIYLPEAETIKQFRITTQSNYTAHDPNIATLAEIGAFK